MPVPLMALPMLYGTVLNLVGKGMSYAKKNKYKREAADTMEANEKKAELEKRKQALARAVGGSYNYSTKYKDMPKEPDTSDTDTMSGVGSAVSQAASLVDEAAVDKGGQWLGDLARKRSLKSNKLIDLNYTKDKLSEYA